MSKLLIVGAKGFAKELLEAVVQGDPVAEVTFYDDVSSDLPERLFEKFEIIRTAAAAADYFDAVDRSFALGIGAPQTRERLFEKFVAIGGRPRTVISPFAKIGRFANNIGVGSCILADAVIESNNNIGTGTLVHVGVLVSHDVSIGEFCEVSPRANLLGAARVGDRCRIGTASVILPGVVVGDDVTVGAGAVVTKDVPGRTTVVGVPARPLER